MKGPEKPTETLIPPDVDRCQALKPSGTTAFSMGGVHKLEQCQNKPLLIITETEPVNDNEQGSMSVCLDCYIVFTKQFPSKIVTLEKAEDQRHDFGS